MLAGRIAALLACVAILAPACGSSDLGLDEGRARAHINTLAGTIGRRPVGSAANARAREYIVDDLTRAGFIVRLQETDVSDDRAGLTAHVVNVMGWHDGRVRDAIALASHYDSVPDGPGASDDALGVATCLEAGRALLAAGSLQHSLLVLVTDGEEAGLRGARAAVTDPDVGTRVRAFLNFDGTGAAGSPVLFEVGPGRGAPLDAWARAAAAPTGASFGYEIFRRLPNDTDFTVLKTLGASGLNFAPVDESYAYHTDRDRPDRVQPATLRRELVNTVTTVRALDRQVFGSDAGTPTYFDIAHVRAFVYGPDATRWIAIVAGAAGSAIWIWLAALGWRARGGAGIAMTPVTSLLSVVVAFAAAVAAAWLMRAVRGELMPWYASPGRFCLWLIAAGLAGRWIVSRVAGTLPERWQPWRSPLAVWFVTLPVWIGLLAFLQAQAPAASFLVAWPLLAAAVLLPCTRGSSAGARATSFVVFGVVVLLWLDNIARLVRFVVALFGWMNVVPPIWLLPALLAAGGIMLGPPLLAMFSRRAPARGSMAGPAAAVSVVLVVTSAFSWFAPAYTRDRPERRTVRFVQDDIQHKAWWEVTGSEPRLGLAAGGGPGGAEWSQVTGALPASMPISPPAGKFLFRAAAAPQPDLAMGTAQAVWSRAADGVFDVELTIAARALGIGLALPAGVEPRASTLAGVSRGGRWTARYVGLLPVHVRLRLDRDPADVLRDTTVQLSAAGLPDSAGAQLRPWLEIPEVTWGARTEIVIPVLPQSGPRGR